MKVDSPRVGMRASICRCIGINDQNNTFGCDIFIDATVSAMESRSMQLCSA